MTLGLGSSGRWERETFLSLCWMAIKIGVRRGDSVVWMEGTGMVSSGFRSDSMGSWVLGAGREKILPAKKKSASDSRELTCDALAIEKPNNSGTNCGTFKRMRDTQPPWSLTFDGSESVEVGCSGGSLLYLRRESRGPGCQARNATIVGDGPRSAYAMVRKLRQKVQERSCRCQVYTDSLSTRGKTPGRVR